MKTALEVQAQWKRSTSQERKVWDEAIQETGSRFGDMDEFKAFVEQLLDRRYRAWLAWRVVTALRP